MRFTLKQLVAPSDGVLRREEIEALVAADVPIAEWPAGELRKYLGIRTVNYVRSKGAPALTDSMLVA